MDFGVWPFQERIMMSTPWALRDSIGSMCGLLFSLTSPQGVDHYGCFQKLFPTYGKRQDENPFRVPNPRYALACHCGANQGKAKPSYDGQRFFKIIGGPA